MVRDRLDANEADLSTIPAAAQEILAATQSADCTLQDLETVVSRDQVIASRIVQMANSSFYRGLTDVLSLPQALMRLGFNEVHNVTLAVALKQVYQGVEGRYGDAMQRLWKGSVAGAVTSRELARASRYPQPEEAFLAGLVRDLGCVFIVDTLLRMGDRDSRVQNLPEEILQDLLDVLHEDAGAQLLEKLEFNESICEAVGHHHDPSRLEGGARLAWILAAADLVVRKLGMGGEEPEDLPLSSQAPMRAIDLNDLAIARILVDLEDRSKEMMVALD
jgi:HD-like signal output (HDOD) protein